MNKIVEALAVSISLVLLSACVTTEISVPVSKSSIYVSVLIQFEEGKSEWYADVEIDEGFNAYQLIDYLSKGDLISTYHDKFLAHFIESIFGIPNQDSYYWLAFLWNSTLEKWELLSVGADLFVLKGGEVLAWSYTDTNKTPISLPISPP